MLRIPLLYIFNAKESEQSGSIVFTTYGEGMLSLQDYQSVLILLSSAIASFIQIQIRLLQSYLRLISLYVRQTYYFRLINSA